MERGACLLWREERGSAGGEERSVARGGEERSVARGGERSVARGGDERSVARGGERSVAVQVERRGAWPAVERGAWQCRWPAVTGCDARWQRWSFLRKQRLSELRAGRRVVSM